MLPTVIVLVQISVPEYYSNTRLCTGYETLIVALVAAAVLLYICHLIYSRVLYNLGSNNLPFQTGLRENHKPNYNIGALYIHTYIHSKL